VDTQFRDLNIQLTEDPTPGEVVAFELVQGRGDLTEIDEGQRCETPEEMGAKLAADASARDR
jgi:hypothetical protein